MTGQQHGKRERERASETTSQQQRRGERRKASYKREKNKQIVTK